jgi:hypothetical protein
MKIRKSRWVTKELRSPRIHWARKQNRFFSEATVQGRLLNVDFMAVKDSKRFADSAGSGYPVLDFDTAFDTFKPRTSAGTAPQGMLCAARISIDTFIRLVFLVRRGLIANVKASTSNSNRKSNFGDLTVAAERELGAFVNAVSDLYGPDQARLAAEDWLLELEMMDMAPELSCRVWRTLTIVSASRLAVRLNAASSDTKVSPDTFVQLFGSRTSGLIG